MPILHAGKPLGVLDIQSPSQDAFTKNDVLVMETLAKQIGVGLNNAWMYEQTKREIRERLKAETALQQSEALFRNAFEAADHGMALVALDGRWLQVNQTLCDILGYPESELLTLDVPHILDPAFTEVNTNLLRQLIKGEIKSLRTENRYFHKDGHVVWVYISATMVRDNAHNPLYVVVHIMDISERKKAERLLRWLSRAVEQSPDIVLIINTAHEIEYANPKFEQVTGYALADALGMKAFSLYEDNSQEMQAEITAALAAEGEWRSERRHLKQDGSWYWAAISVSPIKNNQGNVIHYLVIQQDVTEQKRFEEAIQHTQKLKSLGVLAGGIAHDFNNILTAIMSQNSLALMKLSAASPFAHI